VISRFVRKYPHVEVQLQLSVSPPPLPEDAFDVCIRLGEASEARVVARRIAPNRRILCAASSYRHGISRSPSDLVRHNCIGIRQGEAYGVSRLTLDRSTRQHPEAVKIRGTKSTGWIRFHESGEFAESCHRALSNPEYAQQRGCQSEQCHDAVLEYVIPNPASLQEQVPNDYEVVAQGIEPGEQLYAFRHVADRKGEARQHHHGHDEK
jgi:DNA-binding transcriptional LysR family regulator